MYNGGSTFGRTSINSSVEAQNIKHLVKNMKSQNKIKRYIFKRSKEEMMHADDFKKVLPGNADVRGVLFDESDSDEENDQEAFARSASPLHKTEFRMQDENAS